MPDESFQDADTVLQSQTPLRLAATTNDRTRGKGLILAGWFTAILPSLALVLSANTLFFVPLLVGIVCIFVGSQSTTSSTKRRLTWLGMAACIVATIGPFALRAYFEREGPPIRIVLPNGYQGKFSIVKDRSRGQDLEFENAAVVFRIPTEGVLYVNDDYPIYMWHQVTYVDREGAHVEAIADGVSPGKVQTGTNSWRSSTEFDGTTHRFEVRSRTAK